MWIAVNGEVYNVTEFAADHPGGVEVLEDVAGRDATPEFNEVGHSEYALETMQTLRVGSLKGAVKSGLESTKFNTNSSPEDTPMKPKEENDNNLLGITLAALAVALGVYLIRS
mmetsp:Transcript_3880/g.4844  ORF Transcript_3880/g.4844 Transcript_3880/m.4844 type:complete len:113 (+) Transcript_3880:484-822(+)